ncbi:MAG: tetratricopeptide repeat protein [Bacteroidota bacterium]
MLRATKPVVVVVALLLFFPFIAKLDAQELKDAVKLTKSEQFKKASSMFRSLIKQTPANGDLYYFYGRNFLDNFYSDTLNISFTEMADSARMVYQQGLQQDPANPLNFVGLGGLDLINKKIPEAQGEFAKAMALLPSKANKQLKMDPAKHSRVLIEMAESYVAASVHDTGSVFNLLRTAEKLDNKNPNLFIVKGDVYFYLLNDGSKAIQNYNMAQSLDPKSPEAKLRVGQLWMRARQYTNALNYYQEVVKMDSTFAPAYRELGSLLSRAGRQEEAKKNFYKFLELSKNTAARKQFVNTLIELKNYTEAITQLNEITKVDNTDNDVNRALAYSYFETQQYDKGLTYIKKFIANAKPEKIRALDYTYYGRLLSKTKQDSLASEQLLKAYTMDTSKAELISEAALSYTRIKKYDKAMEQYERKLKLKKGVPMDYYNLGKVYYSLQDYVKADTNLAIFNLQQPDYIPGFAWRARTKSNLDQKDPKGFNMTGMAVPVYENLIQKTQGDTVKYMKERFESFDYLAFYHYSNYMRDLKLKEEAEKALFYYTRMSAVNPNDEKVAIVKPVIDALKLKVR